MAVKPLPPQSTLLQLFHYDPETGLLSWKARSGDGRAISTFNARFAGAEALGYASPRGYKSGKVMGITLQAHRVIWKLVHGDEPKSIDHIDGDPSNNRLGNLRSVTTMVNHRNMPVPSNNVSGRVGVSWDKKKNRWAAIIGVKGRNIRFGMHRTFEDAVAAREAAEMKFGFHPNHGRLKAGCNV